MHTEYSVQSTYEYRVHTNTEYSVSYPPYSVLPASLTSYPRHVGKQWEQSGTGKGDV